MVLHNLKEKNNINDSPVEGIHPVELMLVLLDEPLVLGEPGLDVFVVEELGEDGELLLDELVGEVHSGVQHTTAVGADAVGNVLKENNLTFLFQIYLLVPVYLLY